MERSASASRSPTPKAFFRTYYVPSEHGHGHRRQREGVRDHSVRSRSTWPGCRGGDFVAAAAAHPGTPCSGGAEHGRDPAREGEPIDLEGYHKPSGTASGRHPLDAMPTILTGGRTSRLYRPLVREQEDCGRQEQVGGGLPGAKYPDLGRWRARPRGRATTGARGVARRSNAMKSEDVTDEELTRFKTRAKADLLRSLASNEGVRRAACAVPAAARRLARAVPLCRAHGQGDEGRHPRVAGDVFRSTNRTVAMRREREAAGRAGVKVMRRMHRSDPRRAPRAGLPGAARARGAGHQRLRN